MATQVETCYRHTDRETRVHCTRCNRPICPDCMEPAPVGHHCPTCIAEARRSVRRVRRVRIGGVVPVLLGVNIAAFAVELLLRATTELSLISAGAMVPALIAEGEHWRLMTSIFLHFGFLHLALNMFGLYLFGTWLEQALGSVRFAAVYLVTGFWGSVVSFTLGGPVRFAAGASGAVFGLLGAWLAYNWRRRRLSVAQGNIRIALILIVINLVFGVVRPGIDNFAHLGGLAAGLIAGFLAEGVGRRRVRTMVTVAGLTLLALGGVALTVVRVGQLVAA